MSLRTTEADADFKRKVLTASPVFHSTPEDDLAEVARCGRLIAVARGKPTPHAAGGPHVFVVERGVIAGLQADHENTKPVLTGLFGPGAICGLQIALTQNGGAKDGRPAATARCLSNVSAIAVPVADLLRVARRCPELSLSLMTALAAHTDETAKLLAQSLHRSLELRLAALFSRISDLVAGDDWRPTASIGKISQSFAAELLGVSREHVNRTLTMWEKSGLIFQNRASEIIVQNRKRLATIASDGAAAPQSVKEGDWLWEIDSYLDRGLNQTAYHLAMEASRRTPRDMRFRHRAVLATARSGAVAEALSLIDKLELKHDYTDEELGCLLPRILRDLAFLTEDDEERRRRLAQSAEEYAKVFEKCRKNYSGLNAAYGYALLNDLERASSLARVVGDLAHEKLAPLDEDDDSFWLRATVAECKLLERDLPTALTLFQSACRANDVTPGKKATTRHQLFRAAPHLGVDKSWIDRAVPQAKTMFFSGPLAAKDASQTDDLIDQVVDEVSEFMDKNAIECAYGALASGCDIAVAEALIEAGVQLNVYLPLAPSDFMKSSVAAFGEPWGQRFTECMRAAASIEWNRRAPVATRAAYQLGAHVAMGKAVRRAQELHSEPLGFFATQDAARSGQTLSIINLRVWEAAGLAFHEVRGDWPRKNGDGDAYAIRFAATVQHGGDPAPEPPAAACAGRLEDADATAFLFERQAEADAFARALAADPRARAWRIWLDVGVFDGSAETLSADALEGTLITASCRPLSDPGRVCASDVFAHAAATGLGPSRRFEYIGYTSTQVKLDPCPLYLVG